MDKTTREKKIQEFIDWRNDKIVHYGTWKPSPELLEEYKDELEIYHKWAKESREMKYYEKK